MRKIDKPTLKVKDVYSLCISLVRTRDLKGRLTACEALIIAAEDDFEEKIAVNEIHKILEQSTVNGNVSTEEMKKVYTARMVQKGSPGRKFYDQILSLAPLGKCPLCAYRIASTLDHYLSKATHPLYVVTPVNLIPACKDCNTTKNLNNPKSAEEETIHPYFDDIEKGVWLKAEVINTSPVGFRFFVDPPPEWGTLLKKRIENHFEIFNIQKLYTSHAAEELSNIKLTLQNLLKLPNGENVVKEHLKDCAKSRNDVNQNSWQTATYNAMWENEWFCKGGFDFT